MSEENKGKSRDATIIDIAKALNLSFSTVSRALSDHRHISDATKARVRKTAAAMNYTPNAAARAIQRQRSNLVGLIVPDIENAFYARVAKVVSERCMANGYQLVLAIAEDDRNIELAHVQALRQARAAAIAITPCFDPLPKTIALLKQFHAVQLVRAVPGLSMPIIQVAEYAGIMEATRHLIGIGHREIAFIGGSSAYSTGAERLRGYREALLIDGLSGRDDLVRLGPPRAQFGEEAMAALLSDDLPPTAVIAAGYELTVGAVRAMARLGVSAPSDISLIAYGDVGITSSFVHSLTTIAPPVQQIAVTTAELLLSGILQSAAPAHTNIPVVFSPALVLGGSVAPHTRGESLGLLRRGASPGSHP